MPHYQFKALTADGKQTQGNLFAMSTADAVEMLAKRGWVPVRIESPKTWLPELRYVTLSQQVAWYSMLADLLASGMPIADSLELLVDRTTNPQLAEATRDIRSRVIQGESLSQSMRHHPKVFDSLAQCLVAAGEEGAFIDQVLEKIAAIKDAKNRLLARLISAFAYPVFLLIIGAVVFASMMLFFVPKFEPLFARMRETQGLPWATEMLFTLNHFVTRNWLVTVLVIGAGITAAVAWCWNPKSRLVRDRFLLKNRLLGQLLSGITQSRFCQILGSLLSSGVRIQQATLIAGQASGNRMLEVAAERAVEKLTAGVNLADALNEQSVFPRDIIELIRMGEKTNRLEKVLQTTAVRLEARNEQALELVLRLLEPMLMVVMALLIGFVMVALLMPIFNASGTTFQ
ncbi:MAG: type II secretion system F family protein [Pirellulaceae bacterium]|nr:type II secretion system F family protein [Pirellulaceae bacterium]